MVPLGGEQNLQINLIYNCAKHSSVAVFCDLEPSQPWYGSWGARVLAGPPNFL